MHANGIQAAPVPAAQLTISMFANGQLHLQNTNANLGMFLMMLELAKIQGVEQFKKLAEGPKVEQAPPGARF